MAGAEEENIHQDAAVIWERIQTSIREQEGADILRNRAATPWKRKDAQWAGKTSYPTLFGSYVKVGLRNLLRNKVPSFINVFGLSMGMAVTLLIGLWIWDELAFNTNFQNYDRIAQVWQRGTAHGEKWAQSATPVPLAEELRRSYPADFRYIVATSGAQFTLSYGDKKFTQAGNFMESEAPDMLSLHMLEGGRAGLKDPSSILL